MTKEMLYIISIVSGIFGMVLVLLGHALVGIFVVITGLILTFSIATQRTKSEDKTVK